MELSHLKPEELLSAVRGGIYKGLQNILQRNTFLSIIKILDLKIDAQELLESLKNSTVNKAGVYHYVGVALRDESIRKCTQKEIRSVISWSDGLNKGYLRGAAYENLLERLLVKTLILIIKEKAKAENLRESLLSGIIRSFLTAQNILQERRETDELIEKHYKEKAIYIKDPILNLRNFENDEIAAKEVEKS